MAITIVLKDGSIGEFSSGAEASDWYQKQMTLRLNGEKKAKNKKKKEDKK
jgi:hypothetical protein